MKTTFGSGATTEYGKRRVKEAQNINPPIPPLPKSCVGEEKTTVSPNPHPSPAHPFDYQAFGLSQNQYRLYCAILERAQGRRNDDLV